MSIEEARLLQAMPAQLEAYSRATGHSPQLILAYLASEGSEDSKESEDDQSPEASPEGE